MRISDWSSDVCSSDLTELQLQPLCACPLRGTVALVTALPKPARGLGHSVTIHMAGDIACPDLGDKVHEMAGLSFVQWRSEERRLGKECVKTCRCRGSQYHVNKYIRELQRILSYTCISFDHK